MRDNYLKGRTDQFEFPRGNFHRLFLLLGRLLSQDFYKAHFLQVSAQTPTTSERPAFTSSKSYTLSILHHSFFPRHSYFILFLNSFMSSICHYLRFSFIMCPSLSQFSISSMEAGALPVYSQFCPYCPAQCLTNYLMETCQMSPLGL